MAARAMLTLAAVLVVVAGCGEDTTETTTSAAPVATTAVAETTTTVAETIATSTTVAETATTAEATTTTAGTVDGDALGVATSDFGDILVDGEGFTLYLFALDEGGASACTGRCLDSWPPVPAEPAAAEGVDDSLIGSITRDDGNPQATYGGHPLYRFAGDAAPGDTNGQGANDVWFMISPTGEAIDSPPVPNGEASDY